MPQRAARTLPPLVGPSSLSRSPTARCLRHLRPHRIRANDGAQQNIDPGDAITSWAFGRRLRAAGLVGSIGSVGDAFNNAVAASCFATLKLQFPDRCPWSTREDLAAAIFEWIECFSIPTRRHSHCGTLSPVDDQTTTAA